MFRFSRIRIIGFLVLQLEIMREVHSLKCHVNEAGKEPKETECVAPANELCGHVATGGKIERKCMPKGQIGCTKMGPEVTICLCEADNCNHECTAGTKCEPVKPVARQMANASDVLEICDAKCNAPGGGSGGDDAGATEGGANAAPTGNVPGATEGGAGAAATGDGAGATGGGSAATSGNQRVVESNQFVFLIWILVILSINSL